MISRSTPLKRSTTPIKRSQLKRKPTKKRGDENPGYLEWLRTWPCFVCFKRAVAQRQLNPYWTVAEVPSGFRDYVAGLWRIPFAGWCWTMSLGTFRDYVAEQWRIPPGVSGRCLGKTHAAHVGPHGMRQKCPDAEAIPLGQEHHLHATAGGGPESHHTLGFKFWEFHGLDRDEVLELLHRLYREDTGKEV